jgi:hypothetical protein
MLSLVFDDIYAHQTKETKHKPGIRTLLKPAALRLSNVDA